MPPDAVEDAEVVSVSKDTAVLSYRYGCKITANDVPGVPEAYEINARALAEQRVALAGYRLARQLGTLFPAAP